MGQTESGWQLEASAPELYERYMVPAVARLWAADLVERAAPKRGERVLDVACLQDPFTRRSAHPPPRWQSNGSRHPLPAPSERPLGKRTALHEIVVLLKAASLKWSCIGRAETTPRCS